MSDRMTAIEGPAGGYQAYGRKTRAEMLAGYRKYYQNEIERAQKALAVPDDELVVTTFLGMWARRNEQVVTGADE
jgi:hypothetical protein